MSDCELLRMEHITKQFAGVNALKDVCFTLKAGEVHAIVGENGAGKSTLIKILSGVYRPNDGAIYLGGERVELSGASDALRNGIATIYQEFNLVPSLSIAENIFLGKELQNGCVADRRGMIRKANAFMAQVGFAHLDSSCKVASLSVAQQQMVEIIKSLFNDSRILVLDEPTAVLTEKESERLFAIIRTLREKQVGIIYISHRLEEVLDMADRVTVFRDGECIDTLDNAARAVTKEQLVSLMVGRKLSAYYPERHTVPGEPVLEARGLTRRKQFSNISFTLHRGEILGITGLVGAGMTDVVRTLFGATPLEEGSVLLNGRPLRLRNPQDAMRQGIAFIPENRKEEGLFLDATMADNMIMANYPRVSVRGVLRKNRIRRFLEQYFTQLDIRPNEPRKIARNFSGGNQQKAIIAKWIAIDPQIMILAEPTRGIDINAKAEIYRLMNRLVENGLSILMVSSEMQEIIGMCDRVLVMAEGKMTGEFARAEFAQDRIMAASSGLAV